MTTCVDIRDVVEHCAAGASLAERRFDGNMFTHAAYLRSHGFTDTLVLGGDGVEPALFRDCGAYLVYLGRLQTMSRDAIMRYCASAFTETTACFVVFEDIRFVPDGAFAPYPLHVLRYQANWRRRLNDGEKHLSSKQASNLRRKLRKLREALGGEEPELQFERCGPGDVEAVVRLNKAKIEGQGRHHYMSDGKLASLERLCGEIGYTASLTCGGELLAGVITCVAGVRGYVPLLGHDLRYEKFSTGMQVTALALDALEQLGCSEVNFLWGDSRWKSDFGATREQLATVIVRRTGRVVLSGDYRRVVVPYAVQAAKTALRPYVRRIRRC